MKAFSFVPLMITLILLAMCFSAKAARSSPDWRNAVYLPKLLLWVGLLGNIFVIPATLLLWQQKWSHLWFVGLCLLGWALELAYANCWVKFSERGFTHHTFWGRTYEYTYLDITDIRLSSDVKLYCGRHLIFLDSLCLNRDCFLRRVDSKSKNLRILPPRLKWDPYEDKVSNGARFSDPIQAGKTKHHGRNHEANGVSLSARLPHALWVAASSPERSSRNTERKTCCGSVSF